MYKIAYSCKFSQILAQTAKSAIKISVKKTIFVTLIMFRKGVILLLLSAGWLADGSATLPPAIHHEVPTKARPLYTADTLTICVAGDIMMHITQIEKARRANGSFDFRSYFSQIKDDIQNADISIANMEFTLGGEPYTGYPAFSAPDSYANYLADCGFDIFLTANNHILDKGCSGAERTLAKYRELNASHGIQYCGTASDQADRDRTTPLFITAKGMKIAIINCTYGTNLGADMHWPKVNYMNNSSLIKDALKKAEEADFTIVFPHWGTEYSLTSSEEQQEKARWLIENGADMIIGTHPHVVQNIDTIKGVQIIYSLGNAVSNMSAPDTQLGLMAKVRIIRKPSGDIIAPPVSFKWLWCSRPGGYNNSHTVLPVLSHADKRNEWNGAWEHDKMMKSYERVRKATEIEEK